MKEITVDAVIENINVVTDFVDKILDAHDCPVKIKMQIDIAIDEIFSNISRYAYKDGAGRATVRAEVQETPKAVSISFADNGIPYNPLEKADPDITLSAEEREIGGLGIYMVKKKMDEIQYDYSDGRNCLIIKKYIE